MKSFQVFKRWASTLSALAGILVLSSALLAGAALADTVEDCVQDRDRDLQIRACTSIIARGGKVAWAYNNRGLAYYHKGDKDRAIADYDKAIALDPKDAQAYYDRGVAFYAKGDRDRAIADYDKAIALDPKYAKAYYNRGVARYDSGDFEGAARDLLRTIELSDNAFAMLYLYLARARSGKAAEDELAANAGRLKTKEWPFAVTELFVGKRSPAATINAAAKPDDKCEAQFYVGQWQLLKGNRSEAEVGLKAAVETCPKTFSEYTSAVAELKRLKR